MLAHLPPDAAALLALFGVLLVYLEFNVPGKVVPGALGMLFVMLAIFAFLHAAVSAAALALVGAGVGLVLLELRFRSRNLLALAGASACAFGLLHLVKAPNAAGRVHISTAIFVSAVFTTVTVWLGRIALQARRNKAIQPRESHPAPGIPCGSVCPDAPPAARPRPGRVDWT